MTVKMNKNGKSIYIYISHLKFSPTVQFFYIIFDNGLINNFFLKYFLFKNILK
jgi:hypothetical protein